MVSERRRKPQANEGRSTEVSSKDNSPVSLPSRGEVLELYRLRGYLLLMGVFDQTLQRSRTLPSERDIFIEQALWIEVLGGTATQPTPFYLAATWVNSLG